MERSRFSTHAKKIKKVLTIEHLFFSFVDQKYRQTFFIVLGICNIEIQKYGEWHMKRSRFATPQVQSKKIKNIDYTHYCCKS